MLRLSDHDAAVALCVDRRYAREWPRIKQTFGDRVRHLSAFVDGDGRQLHPELYDQLTLSLPPSWSHGQGAYQHFRAVQEIVQRAKDEGLESVLLIEDDCVLAHKAVKLIHEADRQAHELGLSWDVLYYGANHSDAETEAVSPNLLKVNGSLTTHLVAFHRRSYDAVLSLKPTHVIDNLIARFLHPKLNCYSVWPAAAVQSPGFSYLWNQQVDYSEVFKNKGRVAR